MREDEFRERLQGALGEPPPLRQPDLSKPAGTPSRTYAAAMVVVAAVLAVALIVVMLGTRVLLRPQGNVGPGPSASPVATAAAADSFPCMLPVIATIQVSDAITQAVGFVNVPSGGFQVDPNATVSDLPRAPRYGPTYYSAALSRWVPASRESLSPQGTSYAYVTQAGKSAVLHVVDASRKTDRTVWTYAESIDVHAWDQAGIVVMTVPFAGGEALLWRVDPMTGKVSRLPNSEDPLMVPLSALPGSGSYSLLGNDGKGSTVVRFGSRDEGTKYKIVLVTSGHVTATIYSGVVGDAKDFDPDYAVFDAHGIWLSNFDAKSLWLWRATSGLQKFPVSGLPKIPADPRNDLSFRAAGPCIAGTFKGVAPSPVVVPTPSPSHSPPYVDWAPILARPLQLPAVARGASCPVSDMQHIDTQINTPKKGSGPDYGYGQWPVYLSGQIAWYSAGSQGILILTSPEYTGPVLVRAVRLDGAGAVTLTGVGQDLGGGATGIAQGGSPPYWGAAFGTVTFSEPGCYGIQFDGRSFTSIAVIKVEKGPPPPG